jgi:hypothetical protein
LTNANLYSRLALTMSGNKYRHKMNQGGSDEKLWRIGLHGHALL